MDSVDPHKPSSSSAYSNFDVVTFEILFRPPDKPNEKTLADPRSVTAKDTAHGQVEEHVYCFGEVDGGVPTVRFTYSASVIRIIGAGYWRKGKAIYERENKIL